MVSNRRKFNQRIKDNYESDKLFDQVIVREQLNSFIAELDNFNIKYESEINSDIMWIKINLTNIEEEAKNNVRVLLKNPEINFNVKYEKGSITCIATHIKSSY